MERVTTILVMVFVAAGLSAAQAGTLYKWVDSQGRVSYHDRPPPEGSDVRVEEKNIGSGAKSGADDTLDKIIEKYPVVLYSVPTCGSCDLARNYLDKRKVPYSEHNLENNTELQQKVKQKFGELTVPIITVGGKLMKGYMESLLEGELDTAGYPKIGGAASAPDAGKDQEETPATDNTGQPASDEK